MGAYYQLLTPGIPELGGWVYMGPFDPQAYWYEFTGIVTNTTPTDAYRGAGRPEATYVVERIVDSYARRIGKDPVDVRRMNLQPPHDEARTSIMGLNVDSANYEPLLDKALALVEYDKLRAEQRDRRDRGDTKQVGIGLSTYLEMCGLAPSNILGALRYAAGGWDGATIECLPSGEGDREDRDVPPRAGPRDRVGADRGRRARRDARTTSTVLHGDTQIDAARDGHVRVAVGVRRRGGAPLRDGEDQGEGADDRGARARGRRGRPRMGRRVVARRGRAGQGEDDPGARGIRLARALAPRRDGTAPERDRGLRPSQLHLAGRHAHLRGRGRHRDRGNRDREVRRGRRRRDDHQPDDRGGADPRRRRPGDRGGPVRGGDLRRGGQPHHLDDDAVSDPQRQRDPRDGDGQLPGNPVVHEPARREGRRGDRDDRVPAGRRERGDRRALAPRGHRDRETDVARTRLASDPGGEGQGGRRGSQGGAS